MDKAERRSELLRAARDVFATKGYHNAKIDDIVQAAKVAKGTFYLYFPDKRHDAIWRPDALVCSRGRHSTASPEHAASSEATPPRRARFPF